MEVGRGGAMLACGLKGVGSRSHWNRNRAPPPPPLAEAPWPLDQGSFDRGRTMVAGPPVPCDSD